MQYTVLNQEDVSLMLHDSKLVVYKLLSTSGMVHPGNGSAAHLAVQMWVKMYDPFNKKELNVLC